MVDLSIVMLNYQRVDLNFPHIFCCSIFVFQVWEAHGFLNGYSKFVDSALVIQEV